MLANAIHARSAKVEDLHSLATAAAGTSRHLEQNIPKVKALNSMCFCSRSMCNMEKITVPTDKRK